MILVWIGNWKSNTVDDTFGIFGSSKLFNYVLLNYVLDFVIDQIEKSFTDNPLNYLREKSFTDNSLSYLIMWSVKCVDYSVEY